MPIDFIADEGPKIDFQPDTPSQPGLSLADFLAAPDAALIESSPLTPAAAGPAAPMVAPVPKTEAEIIASQVPSGDVPLEIGAAPATLPRFGAPGTITRGASDTLSGLAEWALNKPEEALATLTPLAPAVAARYTPEIAAQFVKDVAAGLHGDKEAIGRALSLAALVGGPKALRDARAKHLAEGAPAKPVESPADIANQLQQPGKPNLTPRDLRQLAVTRPPQIEEPSALASAAPPSNPGEVIAPDLLRTGERQGQVTRPPIGIDITNEQGIRFGPEFWSFEPDKAAPAATRALESSSGQLRAAANAAADVAQQSILASKLGIALETGKVPELVGMGGAAPAEFIPPPAPPTSIKNAAVDAERAARGLPPAVEPLRRSFGAVWDEAMAKVDADPAAQDKLIADLRANPRAATDLENALLLHRQVDLQNDFGKATRDLAQAVDDGRPEDAVAQQARVADLSDHLLDLYNIGKKVGTETGRGLNARKMLANQDFTLANMVTERRAANKGKPLTERQAAETAQAQAEIAGAVSEANARPSVEADFELDRAKKKWAGQLANDADANAPAPTRILQRVGNAINDVRTILTSFDLSALLRQGKLTLATRPSTWARAIAPSIRAAASPLAAFRIDHAIATRPNAPLYARSGLYLAEAGHKLTGQEEAFLTRGLARHIPGVKASERAYTTFLNKIRADLFDTFAATLSRDGKTLTLPEGQVIANYINQMTGRGDLAKFNAAAAPMATIFFAPRYVASRFQMLLGQPLYYGALSGKVGWREGVRARKLVAGEYGRALIGLSAIYGLYALGADQLNFDPYSSDFLKLRSNNTRLDPFAGLQQATVFLSREVGGEKTTLKGKTVPIRGKVPYGGATAVDVGTQFLRSKLAPVPGALVDALQSKNIVGEPVTAGSAAANLLVPITYQDILSTLEDQGMPRATALTLLSFLGEGVQTYSAAPKRTK